MAGESRLDQGAFNRRGDVKDAVEVPEFEDLWPSETKGDGRVVANNARTGAAQGKANFTRKAHCQMCGYPVDLNANDHSGGSPDGNGAGGVVTKSVASATLPNGTVHTEAVGSQAYNKGAGCPMCFSKNSSSERIDANRSDPWARAPQLGF
jgi:hypothetical protein